MMDTRDEMRVTVSTGSMVPFIPVGSTVTIRCDPELAREGAPVAYLSGSRLIVHRLTRIELDAEGKPATIHCQGDANPHPDPPFPWESLVGVVSHVAKPTILMRLRFSWWALHRRVRSLLT